MSCRNAGCLVPILSVRSRFLDLGARVCLIALLALASVDAQAADPPEQGLELTLPQARALAAHALQNGNTDLTLNLTKGLVRAQPDDGVSHYLMAAAYAFRQDYKAGRKSAARAYRHSDKGAERFKAAELAARLAYAEAQYSLAQFWLRRTAIHAPDEHSKSQIARDYQLLRQQNPWAFRLSGDLRPSSNVNNGADTALQIIDGVPVNGVLSPTAQALSGLIAVADLAATYRLRATETSATSIGGRVYVQRVALSSSSKDKAPMASGSDYDSTYTELSLRHGFAAGRAGRGGRAAVDLAGGRSWYGGEANYTFARLKGERSWRLNDRSRLTLDAYVEDRFSTRYQTSDASILGVGAQYNRRLGNGDRWMLSVAYFDSDAKTPNGTYGSASLRSTYAFGQPVGPVKLSAGLTLGYSDYPVFQSGLFMVPGGRQDKSIYGDLNVFFDKMDYAGFAPMLRLRTGRKSSNDSRYDTRELSVTLGIQSKF